MRYGLLVLVFILCLVLYAGGLGRLHDWATTAALDEEQRLAIDIRCRAQEGRARRECRTLLKKLYLSGSLDPDKTLRAYCDAKGSVRWGARLPTPPEICVRRYGGWVKG